MLSLILIVLIPSIIFCFFLLRKMRKNAGCVTPEYLAFAFLLAMAVILISLMPMVGM